MEVPHLVASGDDAAEGGRIGSQLFLGEVDLLRHMQLLLPEEGIVLLLLTDAGVPQDPVEGAAGMLQQLAGHNPVQLPGFLTAEINDFGLRRVALAQHLLHGVGLKQ